MTPTHPFASLFLLVQCMIPRRGGSCVDSRTGNFGDILAGYFAKHMGLPIDKLVIATNENDILHRFWQSGHYEKKAVHGREAQGGFAEDGAKAHEDGVKETLAPAMDILVSSNFERLLWFLAYQVYGKDSVEERRKTAGKQVNTWLQQLKQDGGFGVESSILEAARQDFESDRVSNQQTVETIKEVYSWDSSPSHKNYVLDPHSAIGIAATLRSLERAPQHAHHISLSTAHPAKFSKAVEMALASERGFNFKTVLPQEFVGLEDLPRRVTHVKKSEGLDGVRTLVIAEVEAELAGKR
jgi:threonine synthase